jgi:peptidoglycan-associated lipoprotein
MNIFKKALSAVMLATLFVVNSVSADSPASQAFSHPTHDCRTNLGVQALSTGNSFAFPPSGTCKDYIAMQNLNNTARNATKVKDYKSATKAYLLSNVHMRSMWHVDKARRDYTPQPIRATQTVTANDPIDMELTAHFAFDESTLTSQYISNLETFAKRIEGTDHDIIMVEGHTDECGSYSYNEELGMRRAAAVKSVLVGFGIKASKIQTVSYSEAYPVNNAHTNRAWKQNRRASVTTTVYSYSTLYVAGETPAEAKAKYDKYTAEVYLKDYEAKLKQVEAKYPPLQAINTYDEEEASWAFLEAEQDIHNAKVRILFAQFRERENKLLTDLTLDEAIYWANTLSDNGESILADKIANHYNLEFETGEFIPEHLMHGWLHTI